MRIKSGACGSARSKLHSLKKILHSLTTVALELIPWQGLNQIKPAYHQFSQQPADQASMPAVLVTGPTVTQNSPFLPWWQPEDHRQYSNYPWRDGQAELTWVVGQTEINLCDWELSPDTVTYPSTDWTQHKATLPTPLLLSQTVTKTSIEML